MKTQTYLIVLHLSVVFMYQHRKPLPQKLWSQKCDRNSMLLNDCNWCRCTNNKYECKARVCGEVDMFGHFNDAIRDINVGMEGHGVWRSSARECEPGVEYTRDTLHCVCDKNGKWPSQKCRKTLRLLKTVDTIPEDISDEQNCEPNTVKMFGCKLCFCNKLGKINATNCHEELCEKNKNDKVNETYAECNTGKDYRVGTKSCRCVGNNRLSCDQTVCSNKRGQIINVKCNHCYCSNANKMYCTTKSCLNTLNEDDLLERFDIPTTDLSYAETPIDDTECTEGTQYTKDCNTCKCFRDRNMKIFSCSVKKCSPNDWTKDCVVGTTYEKNCHHCHCMMIGGVKHEVCGVDDHCSKPEKPGDSLTMLHGYCQPLHTYKKDCNTCKCLSSGQIMTCTTNICEGMEFEVVPVTHSVGHCPSGFTFKLDCNMCYCLSNGNILCTMVLCK